MELFYTPRSHFSRKVRILIHAYGLEVTLTDVGNVADAERSQFGDHPLMTVPSLVHQGHHIFESDHIAGYLVRQCDEDDRFQVNTNQIDLLNLRAVMNGIMAAEVSVLLAQRTGIPTTDFARFEKLKQSMSQGLGWLESHHQLFPSAPSYAGFHLVCLWDHLVLYKLLPLPYPHLERLVAQFSTPAFVRASQPQ